MRDVVLLGIDWGTSSARAYAFNDQGEVLASVSDSADQACGVQTLRLRLGREPTSEDFAEALRGLLAALSDTLAASAGLPKGQALNVDLPIIACGMIGSQQGLVDAGYAICPSSPAILEDRLLQAHCGPFKLYIVPGLRMSSAQGRLPDFMRGEETQVLGAGTDGLVVLPGSHSKWVDVKQGVITQFETHFSGELFAVLREHSILGRLFARSNTPSGAEALTGDAAVVAHNQAFLLGLKTAQQHPQNLLQHLFSTRALGLDGQLTAASGESFLSGLLIGHEVCAALATRTEIEIAHLVASPQLCERYAQAFSFFNVAARSLGNTSAQGLWRLAVAARLS